MNGDSSLHVSCSNTSQITSRTDVINHLANIDKLSDHVQTMIPMQVLEEIDNSRNPMHLTRERLERAATENQFMNGKIQAIKVRVYTGVLLKGPKLSIPYSLIASITMRLLHKASRI